MADYLTRLVERTLGLPSTVRPEVPPTFAPETGYPPDPEPAGEPAPDTGPVGHAIRRAGDPSRSAGHAPGQDLPERDERTPNGGPQPGARDHAPPPGAEGPAREAGTFSARTARSFEASKAGEGAENERPLDERQEVRSTPPEPEVAEEHVTATYESSPTERPGTSQDEPYDAAPSAVGDAKPSGARAVSQADATGSDSGAGPALAKQAAPDPPAPQTAGREERESEPSVPGARRLTPVVPDLAERTPESRTPVPGAPLAYTGERPRATPPAAVPHRRETTREAPMIRVSIGRVEVRAITAEPAQRPPEERPEPALSLDDYLRQQSGGSR